MRGEGGGGKVEGGWGGGKGWGGGGRGRGRGGCSPDTAGGQDQPIRSLLKLDVEEMVIISAC